MDVTEPAERMHLATKDGDYRRILYDSYRRTSSDETIPARTTATVLTGQILPHLPIERDSRILDLGCGSGELLQLLKEQGYSAVVGVDISKEQVDEAHRRGVPEVVQGDLLEHLDALSQPLDAVIAVDVLEHLGKADVMTALHRIRAALRPGGRLIARSPNAESPFGGRHRYGDFTHEMSFTHHSVRQVLLACGFADVTVFPAEPVVHGPVSAARWVLWKLMSAGLKFALTVETGIVHGHIVTQDLVVVARTP